MKLNNKLLAQMRSVTRALFRKGPAVAAANTVMESALHNASAVQQAIRELTPPPELAAARMDQAVRLIDDMVPEMFATLGRVDVARQGAMFLQPEIKLPDTEARPGSFTAGSYTNAAGTRGYKLYVPGSYTGMPAPLLVMLHGCSQDPDDFAAGTRMNSIAEEFGCLVIYPAQSPQANVSRCWNWFSAIDQRRDQGEPSIIAGITREVMGRYAINPARVYVAGLSAGGAMATIMGTLYPELYAAVGVHSGLPFASAHDLASAFAAMKGEFQRRHKPGQAIPIIVFHGDRDTTVHPAAGEELIAHVRHVSQEIAIEPGQVPDGYAYTRTLHQRADGRVHAEHWVIHGAGHAWSGGDTRGSFTDHRGPNASREMMRFFRTHP
jgi:poly(hydroxyalkanoate) depolymerase family esterase